MGLYVSNISLFERDGQNALKLTFNILPESEVLQKVLLERYIVDINDNSNISDIIIAINNQQPILYMGSNITYISTLINPGLGDVYVDPDIIDITDASLNRYPYIIDDDSDIGNKIILYRVLTYAGNYWEFGTRFIAGIQGLAPLINPDLNIEEFDLIRFLNRRDIEDVVPDNVDGVIQWLTSNSFSFETYRLRQYGEVESFKFTKKETSAWNGLIMNQTLDTQNIYNTEQNLSMMYNMQKDMVEAIYGN